MKPIAQVLEEHTEELMGLAGVVGIAEALSRGSPCIVIMVAALTPDLKQRIPTELEGYPVRIQETGEFRAR